MADARLCATYGSQYEIMLCTLHRWQADLGCRSDVALVARFYRDFKHVWHTSCRRLETNQKPARAEKALTDVHALSELHN